MKKIILVILTIFLSVSLFAKSFPSYKEMNEMKAYTKIEEKTVPLDQNYYLMINTEEQMEEYLVFQKIQMLINLEGDSDLVDNINKGVYNTENGVWFLLRESEKDIISICYNDTSITITYWKKNSLKKKTISRAKEVEISDGKRAGVSTASTRASDAKEDFTWDE